MWDHSRVFVIASIGLLLAVLVTIAYSSPLPCDSRKYVCYLPANNSQVYDLHSNEYVTSVSIEKSENNENYAITSVDTDRCVLSKWEFVCFPSHSSDK